MTIGENTLEKVSEILLKTFPSSEPKQRIKVSDSQVNFACPLCGDSRKNPHKKRGSIILHGEHEGMYKCHNCGRYMSLEQFLIEASSVEEVYLDTDLTAELRSIPKKRKTSKEEQKKVGSIIGALLSEDIASSYCFHRGEVASWLGFDEIAHSPMHVQLYLNERMQGKLENFLYCKWMDAIVLLNQTPSGYVLGLQYRFLNPMKGQAKYRSMGYEELRKKMTDGRDCVQLVPEHVLATLKELSMFFGIARVNSGEQVTITEGAFDSLLLPNAVATSGAGRTPPKVFKYRFMYDDDSTGRAKAVKALSRGESVFLWRLFKKDFSLPNRSKWDFNDALCYLVKKGVATLDLDKYFGNNKFDIINV